MTLSVQEPPREVASSSRPPILQVENLTVIAGSSRGAVPVVTDVSLAVRRGRTTGLVGESGSGKTLTSLAIMRVLPRAARTRAGSIRLDGEDLLALTDREMESRRGRKIAMIFQDPMRSLDPSFTVGFQIAEVARRHLRLSRTAAWSRAVEMMDRVAIRDPHRRARDYPSEFSGGMAQRAMIAMALIAEPTVLIADEPTTALDVTVQAQVLLLLKTLQEEMGLGILLVTHDLGVVAEMCDDVNVMYAGQVVEAGDVTTIFERPRHPYASALLQSVPSVANRTESFRSIPGMVPSPSGWPHGCRFGPRCEFAVEGVCDEAAPLEQAADAHRVRCVRSEELILPGRRP